MRANVSKTSSAPICTYWRTRLRNRFRYTIAFFGEIASVASVIFTVVGLFVLAANLWWGASCLVSGGYALGCS